MSVDIETEIVIERPLAEVVAHAADPTNAPEWSVNIELVEWKTPPPVAVGSQLALVARFFGRRFEAILGAWSRDERAAT